MIQLTSVLLWFSHAPEWIFFRDMAMYCIKSPIFSDWATKSNYLIKTVVLETYRTHFLAHSNIRFCRSIVKKERSKEEKDRIGKWEPERMENGETLPQLLSRSKHIILKHWNKWNEMNSKLPGLPFSLTNSPNFWKDTALACNWQTSSTRSQVPTKLG